MAARTFRNTGTDDIRIACELVVPPGHTSLPIELGGLTITSDGESTIVRGLHAGTLQVNFVSDLQDACGTPPTPPGTNAVKMLGVVDTQALVGHVLRATGPGVDVSIGGYTVKQVPALNETTTASINLYTREPTGTGRRMRVVALGGTWTSGGTTYRAATVGSA